jgi:hypothetical protein
MKSTCLTLCLLSFASHLYAAEKPAPLSLTAQTTYGFYGGSEERKSLLAEAVSLSYEGESVGVSVNGRNWKLTRTGTLTNLSGFDTNASLYLREKTAADGTFGVIGAATYLTSDDSTTNQKIVPFGAVTWKSANGGHYLDIGYASMDYRDVAARQYSATYGVSLFDQYVWSQTRLYYNNLSQSVQGKDSAVSVEERLTWYAIPSTLSLTLYALAGQRIYGYDPDLRIVYTLPDIQKVSGGLTANVDISPTFSLFGDVTYETYEKKSISNSYSATYSTLGLTFKF